MNVRHTYPGSVYVYAVVSIDKILPVYVRDI